MKIMKVSLLFLIILGLTFSVAFAKKHLPEERGKTLFEDPKFAGGSKACSECHPNGKGLEKAADKKEFKIMGKTQKSLEDAVKIAMQQWAIFFMEKNNVTVEKATQAYISELRAIVKAEVKKKETVSERGLLIVS